MDRYELLNGDVLDLTLLSPADGSFLAELSQDAGGGDYFDLLRRVKGPDAFPLRGGRITPEVARSVLYRVAHDMAGRVGIRQGFVLEPGVEVPQMDDEGGLLSLTEAAELIGISRAAAHQALQEERLRGRRVGTAWIIRRVDAESYKPRAKSRGTQGADQKLVAEG